MDRERRISGYPGPLPLAAAWILVGMLAYVRHFVADPTAARAAGTTFELLTWLTCFLPWTAFSPLVFRLEHKYPITGAEWVSNIARFAVLSIPFCYAGAQLAVLQVVFLNWLFRRPVHAPPSWLLPAWPEFWAQLLMFAAVVLASCVIRQLLQLHEREQQAAELALQKSQLESSLRQAELETLRARLNPHFLFNSLQNIAVLTKDDPKTAARMLTKLGELLRAALRQGAAAETPLREEIALTKSYVAVEQMRFGDRLSVLFDIPDETGGALVPTFLLQPIVENALMHGLQGLQGPGVISIASRHSADNLVLTVTDNGVGIPVDDPERLQTGVGLTSTLERLDRVYFRRHSFSMARLPEGGTQVIVTVPFHAGTAGTSFRDEQTSVVGRR